MDKASAGTRRRYFELIHQGNSCAAASQQVGVSLSCGSLWFIDAGFVNFIDKPIDGRYLTQDDRIEIADGLDAGESVKSIAARIGKSYQTVYREIARDRKPDGREKSRTMRRWSRGLTSPTSCKRPRGAITMPGAASTSATRAKCRAVRE
jgi:transposase